MKNLFKAIALICSVSIVACEKSDNNGSHNLALIQHKWSVLSVNGEALRYVGTTEDYYNFVADHILYRYVAGKYDTSYYTLLADDNTLLLYPIILVQYPVCHLRKVNYQFYHLQLYKKYMPFRHQ